MLTAFAADEIAAEQRQVDRVYARLEVIKAETAEIEAAGYQMARAGTHGALVERDAMVYHAARRRRLLDAEHDGLVFGRLDLRTGEARYVGRIGLRDEDARTLVIDWRAPAAPPLFPAPALGVTIVRGGPGTGTPAVALHRAAYLLYADRQRFAGGGVLVVGPSPVFVTYIARVLPSLGEDDVTLSSLGSMVVGVEATRHDPDAVATVKGSLRMARVLARAAGDDPPGAPAELRMLYRGTLLRLDAQDLSGVRQTVLANGAKRNAVRPRAAGHLLDALWRQAVSLLGKTAVPAREEFAADVAERREFIGFMRAWWPRLRPIDVLGWLADPALTRRYGNGMLSGGEVATLVGSLSGQHGPSVEDVALLDELDDLLGTPPAPPRRTGDPFTVQGVREVTTHADRMAAARAVATERPADYRDYAHVVVDESQDVTPMQWRMIGRRSAYASWTVVGDPAQSAWAGDPAETAKARDAALGSRRRSEHLLTTNYRNSAEIFAVAADVVRKAEPDIELPVAVRRTGVAPRHIVADDVPAAVREASSALLGEVEGTVGVIATQATRDEVAGWVDPDPRLQVVTSLEA